MISGLCRSHAGAVVATADDFGKVRVTRLPSHFLPCAPRHVAASSRSNCSNGRALRRPLFAGSTVDTAATFTACASPRATNTWCGPPAARVQCQLVPSHCLMPGLDRRRRHVCHAGAHLLPAFAPRLSSCERSGGMCHASQTKGKNFFKPSLRDIVGAQHQ